MTTEGGRRFDLRSALGDLADGLRRWRVAAWLGWRDAVLPYRRARLGPLWVALQAAMWVVVIYVFLGQRMGAGEPRYPIYLACGVVFFQFITNTLVDGAASFTKDASLIKNIPNPLSVYLYRSLSKSVIVLFIQSPIIGASFFFAPSTVSWVWLLVPPMLVIVAWTMLGVALFLASITPRYRDIPFALNAVMRVMFFTTPVFWLVERRSGLRAEFSQWNPLAHFLNVLRSPLLGEAPPLESIAVTVVSGLVAWGIGLLAFARARSNIPVHL